MQLNPYQITNGIFDRTRSKLPKDCMQTQKTMYSQSNPEREKWSWRESGSWTSHDITKVQSSKQYGTGTKTEILIKGTG